MGEKPPVADALRFGDRYEKGNIAGLAHDECSSADKKGSLGDISGFCGR